MQSTIVQLKSKACFGQEVYLSDIIEVFLFITRNEIIVRQHGLSGENKPLLHYFSALIRH